MNILHLLLTILLTLGITVSAAPITVIPIHDEISPGTVSQVLRGYRNANETQSAAVIIDLDTFGGRVDSATVIRDTITQADIPTTVYVHPRAWSAGALIALSADHIIMAPGSSIGSAEPIPATEKSIAALRGEFAATAKLHHRDPKLAAAMVDKTLGYQDYAPAGSILSLTDSDAVSTGLADDIADRIELTYPNQSDPNPTIHTISPDWSDTLAATFAIPWLQSVLISIFIFSIMAEIKTAGFSGAGILTLITGGILVISHWQIGLAGWLEPLMLGTGILIIFTDIFFVISGILTALGIGLTIGGLFLLLGGNSTALTTIAGGMVGGVILFILIARHLTHGHLWQRITLQNRTDTASGYISNNDYQDLIGSIGITNTPLRPSGTATINQHRYDVITDGEYIAAHTNIIVVNTIGNRIIVKQRSN